MRHRVVGKKLSRNKGERKALRLALMTAMVQHERIKTTRAKAQFVERHIERLITIAKRAIATDDAARGVHARRIIASRLNNDRELVAKVYDVLAPRYATRPGGYTRLLKLGQRKGDAADMVYLEFVDRAAESS
jgi:large subunit ribosomal protein L17